MDGNTSGGEVGNIAVVDTGVTSARLADAEPRASHRSAQLRLEAEEERDEEGNYASVTITIIILER